jgi:hypothetical protein
MGRYRPFLIRGDDWEFKSLSLRQRDIEQPRDSIRELLFAIGHKERNDMTPICKTRAIERLVVAMILDDDERGLGAATGG